MKTLADLVKAAKSEITELSVDDLKAELSRDDTNVLVVDIREPGEVAGGAIDRAVNIPRGILEPAADLSYTKRHPDLSNARERRVVLYCASGGRSALGASVLQSMGFKEVLSLAGGYEAWDKAK